MRVQPYLIFPGTCRDALQFYTVALNGRIESITSIGDSPVPAPPEHHDRVYNAVFKSGDLRFMASDARPEQDPVPGQNIALFLTCPDEATQSSVFDALGAGGQVLFPLADGFGMVADRYGIRWMIARDKQ